LDCCLAWSHFSLPVIVGPCIPGNLPGEKIQMGYSVLDSFIIQLATIVRIFCIQVQKGVPY
jgi:hypothetical protein